MEILIGDKIWSSWSMRPWLALKRTGAPFTETLSRLRRAATPRGDRAAGSPSGLVPVLKDGDLVIWDILAICEYLAEKFPTAGALAGGRGARARSAAAAAAEMHSGFRLPARRVPDGHLPVRTEVEVWPRRRQRTCAAWSSCGAVCCAPLRRPVPARRLVDRRRLLHAGGDPLPQLRPAPLRLRRCRRRRRLRRRLLETPEFLEWEKAALAEKAA